MDDQTTDESVRINSRIYVSEIFCVSPQGDEAELSQKIASLKWHRRELQVSVVELACVAVKLTSLHVLQMEQKNLLEEVEKEEQALLRLRIAYRIQPLEQDLETSAATAH